MTARSDFAIAASARAGLDRAALEEIARWLGATAHHGRPLPADRPVLVFNANEVRLFAPGRKPAAWHPGMAHRRLHLDRDPLAAAIDLRPGETVVDATLGLGHDALLLAAAGAEVLAIEREAPLLYFTLGGLAAYRPDLARRIRAVRAEHAEWLAAAPAAAVDHVYFDPMFPRARAGDSVTWGTLRAVAEPGARLPAPLLREALRVARRTVSLKLAPGERPPVADDVPPARVEGSKRVHFAVWDAG
ncbi:MAG: class I SAM-dependent methyltransferase [bacterium]